MRKSISSAIAFAVCVSHLVFGDFVKANEAFDLNLIPENIENYWLRTHTQTPVYPRRAQERGQSGCVVYSFVIGRNGRAENIEVFEAKPKNTFEEKGREALALYRWKAAPSNASSKPVRTIVTLKFEMENKRSDPYGWFVCEKPYPKYWKESLGTEKPPTCVSKGGSRIMRSCS